MLHARDEAQAFDFYKGFFGWMPAEQVDAGPRGERLQLLCRPNIAFDYMTRTNLMTGGAPYVQAFTNAIVSLIQQGH